MCLFFDFDPDGGTLCGNSTLYINFSTSGLYRNSFIMLRWSVVVNLERGDIGLEAFALRRISFLQLSTHAKKISSVSFFSWKIAPLADDILLCLSLSLLSAFL